MQPHASGDAKPLFDLPQCQQTAVKTSNDRLASNRRQPRQRRGRCNFGGHAVSACQWELVRRQFLQPIKRLYQTLQMHCIMRDSFFS